MCIAHRASFFSPSLVSSPGGAPLSVDIQVVYPQRLVPLSGVRLLSGFSPATLDVIGEDFRTVDEVIINDFVSPDVVVVSATRLFAQVPPEIGGSEVSSVLVVSNQVAVDAKSLLRLRLGRHAGKVSGILRLLQLFVKLLFTTPGSDIFFPESGGGGLRNLGASFGREQGNIVVGDIVVAVNATQRQILAIQARDPSIPRSERLLAATVLEAVYNQYQSSLNVVIEVVSHAGNSATANVTL